MAIYVKLVSTTCMYKIVYYFQWCINSFIGAAEDVGQLARTKSKTYGAFWEGEESAGKNYELRMYCVTLYFHNKWKAALSQDGAI